MESNTTGKIELSLLKVIMALFFAIISLLAIFVYPNLLDFYPSMQPQIRLHIYLFIMGLYGQSFVWLLFILVLSQLLTKLYIKLHIVKEIRRLSVLLIWNTGFSFLILPLVYVVAEADDAPGIIFVAGLYVLFHFGLYVLHRFLCKATR